MMSRKHNQELTDIFNWKPQKLRNIHVESTLQEGTKYPRLEGMKAKDNKMTVDRSQTYKSFISVRNTILFHLCFLPVVPPLEINLGQISNILVDLPHQIVFLVDHMTHEHFPIPIFLAVFSMLNISSTSKSLLFLFLSSDQPLLSLVEISCYRMPPLFLPV